MENIDHSVSGSKLRRLLFIQKGNKIKGISIAGMLLFILLLLISIFIFYILKYNNKQSTLIGNFPDRFSYKTDVIKYINADNEIALSGKISYDETTVIRIFSIVSGTVEDVKVILGSYVRREEELAKIRSGDISNILNDYREAHASYELAKKNLSVAENLYKSKFSSQLDVLTAREAFAKAKDELNRTFEIYKLYGVKNSQVLPYYYIKAPIDGYIVEKNINNKMRIRSDNSENLFTISDLKKVWVYAHVFEQDIAKIQEGMHVTITTLVYPDKEFSGMIENVSSTLDPASRSLPIRIIIDNKDGLLKPEMYAAVKVLIPQPEKLIGISNKGVIFDKDHYFVIIVRKGKPEIHPIEVIKKASDYTYIENGARPGDTLVTEGSLLLYNELANKL